MTQEERRARRIYRKQKNLDCMDRTGDGQLLVNEGHPPEDPDVFVSPALVHLLQPHQLGGVRFM